MLNLFISGTAHIFLACGATDFRKQADSLAAIVSMQFHLDPFADQCVFLFCNRKRNGIKMLRYDSNGFILASKKLLDGMKFQWPKTPEALTYSMNQRAGLETFLGDGRLPLSNNLCGANIKPYATARRAWLFADTPRGARANAVLYTLAESARANKLDVYEYLKYLLMEMPNNGHLEHPEVIDQYLPWSKELPEECRLEHKHKKCFKK